MSLNDPHWGRSSDEEKKNDRGDNEQRSDGVGEDGEEQNARQNPNAQDDRNPADSSADGSRRTSRDAREDDEQRDRRSQGLLSDDDLEFSAGGQQDYGAPRPLESGGSPFAAQEPR